MQDPRQQREELEVIDRLRAMVWWPLIAGGALITCVSYGKDCWACDAAAWFDIGIGVCL